jgi:hypothetical protein
MRKEIDVTVPDWGGRDKGKTFHLTEKPALKAERWAWRMFIALKGTSGYIPLDIEGSIARLGYVGVALRGINAFLAADVDYEKVEPLLDEMMECVSVVRDPKHQDVYTKLLETDIDELRTVGWLRDEIVRLHVGFSFVDALCHLASATASLSAQESSSPST